MSIYATENEVEEIVRQMGYDIGNPAQLAQMTSEIDRYFNEESCLSETDNDDDEDDINQSLFASLSIDPAAQFLRKRQEDHRENFDIQSPIVSRKRHGKNNLYENVDCRYGDESPEENPEAMGLIAQAWQSIHRVYDTCRGADAIAERLSAVSKISNDNDDIDEEYEEDEESEVGESVSVPISSRSSEQAEGSTIKVIVDPSVRPVRSPKPGRAPYKFDPVTRYHLYKEEWKRHPAPGELRRLSLRWKVREFMLRHDVPSLTANPTGRVDHDKDWSPRPYID